MDDKQRENSSCPSQPERGSARTGAWNSLQGRIALFVVMSCVALICGALLVHVLTHRATDPAAMNIKARADAQRILGLLRQDFVLAENEIQRYLISPDERGVEELRRLLREARNELENLKKTSWVQRSNELTIQLDEFISEMPAITSAVDNLIRMRSDNELLFPAMPVMLHEMLPANESFYTAAALAMNSLDGSPADEKVLKLHRTFSEARHTWSLMIGAFRLFVANRMGIFGDPEGGMRARLQNIKIYSEEIDRSLAELRSMESAGGLPLEVQAALTEMDRGNQRWQSAFRKVVEMFDQTDWRMDVPFFRARLAPRFRNIASWLDSLEARLEVSTISDINALTHTGEQVSKYLVIFAVAGVAVSLLFYWMLRGSVLIPISRMARALRAEAAATTNPQSIRQTETIQAPTTEAQDLVAAFEHMREQVYVRQQRLENILDNAAEGIMTFDENGQILMFNGAAQKLFDYGENDARKLRIEQLLPPDQILTGDGATHVEFAYRDLVGTEVEAVARKRNGQFLPVSLKLTTLTVQGQQLFTGLVEDISERQALVAHLRSLAEHDSLTGLLNRPEFERRLRRVIENSQERGQESTLLYMDLDQFKVLNDTSGHAAGDVMLKHLAAILTERVRTRDTIARLGGDEFAVLLEHCPLSKAMAIAEDIREAVHEHAFVWEGRTANLSISIGIVPINEASKSTVEVLNAADRTCYAAKDAGRNRLYVYRESDAELASRRSEMMWVSRVKAALNEDRFCLVAEPIQALGRDRPRRFQEFLLRMIDEDGKLIMPGAFLPAAERYQILSDIDRWVVKAALRWISSTGYLARNDLVAINISGHSLSSIDFLDFLLDAVESSGVDPQKLCFEITETAAVTHLGNATAFIDALKTRGCLFALDDFGSGLSSFGFLKNLRVDFVKIDGAFVRDIANDPVDMQMVASINRICHIMGLQTIAEWAESDVIIKKLRELGVDYAQGRAIGTAIPLPELIQRDISSLHAGCD